MTREKVILTYKRRQASCHSDSSLVNKGDTSSKHPRTLSAAFKGNKRPEESDIFKKCRSLQDFGRSLPKLCPHDGRFNKEWFGKNSSFNGSLDLLVANSVSISSNGIPRNKWSQDSQMSDQNTGVRSSPISFNPTGKNNVHLCKEHPFVDTHVLKEKDFPVEQMDKMILHRTSHKESFKTPLRTFSRRARHRIDASDAQVLNNLNVGEGEDSASSQNENLDAKCKKKGFADQSEVSFPVNENTDSNLTSLNASGKVMARSFEEVASQDPSSGSLAEKKSGSPRGAVVHKTDGSSFSIKYTQLAQEGTPITSASNHSSNSGMKECSSDINHEVKQIKPPKIGTLRMEEPGHCLMDDVQKPPANNILDQAVHVRNSLSNPHSSIRFSSDIDLNEMAPDETITFHLCEPSKSVRDPSHECLFRSQGLSSSAAAEPNGTSKGLEFLETDTQKARIMSSSLSTVNITSQLPISEGDTLYQNQMQMNSSLLDPSTTEFFRENTHRTSYPQKGKSVRNPDSSTFKSQCPTEHRNRDFICPDLIGPTLTQSSKMAGPIRNFLSIGLPSASNGQKKRLGNIASGGRMLGRSQSSVLSQYSGCPSLWSEEELDSLWIGVRRHGGGNWNSMLRDPRLLFSGGRIADDLAKRWNIEQLNLLSAPFIQPLRTLEPDHLHFPSISGKLSSITVVDGYTSHSGHLSELQTSGGYFEKEGSSDGYAGRHHSTKAYVRHQNHGRAQILRQSSSEKLPGDLGSSSAGTNLPHWLRGAPHSDQRAAPARHHLGGQLSPPPGRNSPGEALKRRVLGRRSAGSLEDLNQRALPHEPKSSEEPIFSLNRSRSEPMGQIDLVDLDSDASSEGTISDDQSSGR